MQSIDGATSAIKAADPSNVLDVANREIDALSDEDRGMVEADLWSIAVLIAGPYAATDV